MAIAIWMQSGHSFERPAAYPSDSPQHTEEGRRDASPQPNPPDETAAPAPGLDVVLTFDDGESIPVTLRGIPPVEMLPQPERLVDAYPELYRRAAAGDGVTARMLYRWLRRCRHAFTDEAALNAALQRLRNERVMVSQWTGQTRPVPPGVSDLSEIEQAEFIRPFEFCRGITADHVDGAVRWLEVAAAAGDYLGIQELAVQLGYSQRSVDLLQAFWKDGFVSALPGLAVDYGKGVDGAEPDYMRTYAYKLLYYKLHEAAYAPSMTQTRRTKLIALDNSLRYVGGFLSPEQVAEATELAKRLAGNPNCCKASWF